MDMFDMRDDECLGTLSLDNYAYCVTETSRRKARNELRPDGRTDRYDDLAAAVVVWIFFARFGTPFLVNVLLATEP